MSTLIPPNLNIFSYHEKLGGWGNPHPSLYMNGVQVSPSSDLKKHLGLLLSGNGTWQSHIEYMKAKAWKRINIMRTLKFELDRKALETIYLSFIRPILEYADIVWDNCSMHEKKDLNIIQYEAARIVTKLVSLMLLHTNVCWDLLQERRQKHKLIQIF